MRLMGNIIWFVFGGLVMGLDRVDEAVMVLEEEFHGFEVGCHRG